MEGRCGALRTECGTSAAPARCADEGNSNSHEHVGRRHALPSEMRKGMRGSERQRLSRPVWWRSRKAGLNHNCFTMPIVWCVDFTYRPERVKSLIVEISLLAVMYRTPLLLFPHLETFAITRSGIPLILLLKLHRLIPANTAQIPPKHRPPIPPRPQFHSRSCITALRCPHSPR